MSRALVSPQSQPEDGARDKSLRPKRLADFIGQKALRANLQIFLAAAAARSEALDHVLLAGPPGLGKTTLAQILARELGVNFRATSGPVIARAGDLAALLSHLEARDILFIDEIHRLNPAIEEILYPAMEDFQLDVMIGEGPAARSVKIELPPFTLVGATTRAGLLTTPLRDRFGIPLHLDFYAPPELEEILHRQAALLELPIEKEGAQEIAARARGTPRVAGRLLRRVRDFAFAQNAPRLSRAVADMALMKLDVDRRGLDAIDRRYLGALADKFDGGPVGIDSLAAALGEARDVLEDIVEPFLIQEGLVHRSARGRLLHESAWRHLGRTPPSRTTAHANARENARENTRENTRKHDLFAAPAAQKS